jgi:tRNA pseudouridine38-40 synthase
MNFKLLLQYDGTDFHGWQIQDGMRTVQGELTRVLSLLDGREVLVHGSAERTPAFMPKDRSRASSSNATSRAQIKKCDQW